MSGDRQLVELGAFAARRLEVVLGPAAVPQPVESLPLTRRRLELLPAPADLVAADVQIADGDRAPAREPLKISVAGGQFGCRLKIAATGGDATEPLPRVLDRRVHLSERGLLTRLTPKRGGQILLCPALALPANVMNPLEPEPERSFRHAPLIARRPPVFSRPAVAQSVDGPKTLHISAFRPINSEGWRLGAGCGEAVASAPCEKEAGARGG